MGAISFSSLTPGSLTRSAADAVRQTFRTILSGDADGEPSWVKAIGAPGDAGWFGPGSATWQVNSSLATLVGGIRALLLQACHPLALAGVEDHSSYREDPLGRLQRTNYYVTTSTFGSTAQAEAAAARVRRVHERVVGVADNGTPYSAEDPHLLQWVHIGLTDSMLRAYQAFGKPLGGTDVDADQYVQEMGKLAQALGVANPPTSQRELELAFDDFRSELVGDESTRAVSRFLRFPGGALPKSAWLPYQVLARSAVDLLPAWAGAVLGTPQRAPAVRSLNEAACLSELAALRAVLGTRSKAVELAYQRVGVTPPSR